DGAVVGERAAQPAFRDVGHAGAFTDFFDDGAGLALGADEDDVLAAGDEAVEESLGGDDALERFAHIDDVDEVAAVVDVGLHLGVPAAGTVAEVDARVDEVLDELLTGHDGTPEDKQRSRRWR